MALNEALIRWAEYEHELKKFDKSKKKNAAKHFREMIGKEPREIKVSEKFKVRKPE